MIDLRALKVGSIVRLKTGGTGEVVDNPDDGFWVTLRHLTAPDDPSLVGTEENTFAEAIDRLVGGAA